VVDAEVWAVLRSKEIADLATAEAVVLETDGSFPVVPKVEDPKKSTLQRVSGWERGDGQRG
jgi:uncharacterized membrane protein YcaP (DUF421 family)